MEVEDDREMSRAKAAGPGKGDSPLSPICGVLVLLYLSKTTSFSGADPARRIGSMGDARKMRGASADAVMTI